MGLWTWAELTAGILVSCLPIAPRFFQHIGPKVYASFTANRLTSSLFSARFRLISNKRDYHSKNSLTPPSKKQSLESDTFDKWNRPVMQTSIQRGKKLENPELFTSPSDIRVEQSIMQLLSRDLFNERVLALV
ncbi:MAG: hypothetical protein Q9204_002196 [Flavoplaca sp. TL-2023a]